MSKFLKVATAVLAVAILASAVAASDEVLSVNGNDASAVWFISGEDSMVLNGFDLTAFGVPLPTLVDQVTINVRTPVPGKPIEVVVYQDANGGSPVDATVAGRTTVDITQSGPFTVTFPAPITITQPAVWVGFYLPVGFEFLADTSGSSVLTYWAWTPGGRFDPASLASAAVLGPADGSAPVNINMNGKARITLGIQDGSTGGASAITQTVGQNGANMAVMVLYPYCQAVSFDTGDEVVTYGDSINPHCREVPSWQSPANPQGYQQRGTLYDLQFYNQSGILPGRLQYAVTHCIKPAAEDLNTAVIGNAYGMPRTWRILPTERYGDVVCADVRHGGNLAYFVPGA